MCASEFRESRIGERRRAKPPRLPREPRLGCARLLTSVFAIGLAATKDPTANAKVLTHFDLPTKAPPRSPAQACPLIWTAWSHMNSPLCRNSWPHSSSRKLLAGVLKLSEQPFNAWAGVLVKGRTMGLGVIYIKAQVDESLFQKRLLWFMWIQKHSIVR